MSVNTNQCEFIKKNNERCKRLINKDEKYCWQHIDSEISDSLESLELLETLPDELIQYVLNPYIDYSTESQLIENLTGNRVKLDIDSHLTYEIEYYDSNKTIIKNKKTYLDLRLIKSEDWYPNGHQKYIYNYKNGRLEGKYKGFYENGNKRFISKYKNNKLDGKSKYYYKNGNIKCIINHTNGKLEGQSKGWYENGNIEYIENYKNGNIEYIEFDKNEKLIKYLVFDENGKFFK
jgi:antitoxin component YwqK of YwqJK toxin-antitoxin module